MRTGSTSWKDSKMTNFKALGVAAILSTMIATPGIAQEAVQEPGLQAFLPEPGCRIPIKRDSERHGIGTRRLACERASEADLGETPRQRSQDVTVPHSLAFSAIVHVSANR
jgi:hypothetical protein